MIKLDVKFLQNVNSLEELKEVATEQEIAFIINSLIPNMGLINITYEELWKTIRFLQDNFSILRKSPFISEQAKYIYVLTRLEGKSRTKELNILDDMYTDKEKAKKWRNAIAKYVHFDKGGSDEAFQELEKLYQTMIDM